MNYWWVNHKQTFRQEFDGGYVWCPKRKQDGNRNHFYETMRIVQRGDLVLSYANAAVQGYGLAQTHCYSCPRPNDFGRIGETWDKSGWRVDVGFKRFTQSFRTADYTDLIAPLLPHKYSPIQKSGFGNQGAYFSQISEEFAHFILQIAAPMALSLTRRNSLNDELIKDDGLVALTEWEDAQQRLIISNEDLDSTTRKSLVNARRGQGLFRDRVAKHEHFCRITKVNNPSHLIASHIKPWRESNNEERLSGGNGLLLTPSIDHLFDRGFISFEDNGDLIISPIADAASLEKMGVNEPMKVGNFNGDQKHFLNYHREEILLKAAI
jgi:putative restriction endonuclease